jgi:hypothetical protein
MLLFDHIFTFFPKLPELGLDDQGLDAWGSQGIATYPTCDTPVIPTPHWLQHTALKSPWLYAERATPNAHVSYTDIGDLKFVHTNGSCPVPQEHPSIILNTPSSKIHVTLEDITHATDVKKLWDNTYSLKNTAPGGNGIKVVSYQRPSEGEESFLPFCFPRIKDIDFVNGTKYKLTVESMPENGDVSTQPWKDVIILRPRPMCDIPITQARAFLS